MYAEGLVQKWINERRSYVSENEIKDLGLLGKMALLILQENFEAKYCPSDDGHFYGCYEFKNPLGHYEKVWGLYYMMPKRQLEKIGNFSLYDDAIREIVRLEYDHIYWHEKKKIPEYIEMVKRNMVINMYYKTRYWFIWEEEVWVV